MLLMPSSEFFSKFTSSKSYFRNTIRVSNDAAIKERIKMTCIFCSLTKYLPFLITFYTRSRVFVLQIRVSCAFPTRCTCVEFQLRIERESTYFETHEYSLNDLQRVSSIKYAFFTLTNQIVLFKCSDA